MKEIHNINKWSYIITLLLYLTLYLGLLAQILLGLIQFSMALYVSVKTKESDPQYKNILAYWTVILVYIGLIAIYMFTDWNISNKFFGLLLMIIIPMTLGGFFLFITSQLSKNVLIVSKKNSYEV